MKTNVLKACSRGLGVVVCGILECLGLEGLDLRDQGM